MSTRPTVSDTAERIYDRLGAYHDGDADNGWLLLHLCEAAAITRREVDDLYRHDDTGSGWRRLLDPDRAPDWALPWLAQWVGLPDLPLTADQQRAVITSAPNYVAGTLASLRAAILPTLTGSQYLGILERTDPDDPGDKPYHLTIVTRTAETPSPDATVSAALTQKPVGLVLHHVVGDDVLIDELVGSIDTLVGNIDDL